MKGDHVDVNTAARYCASAHLGTFAHCRRWLVAEFEARGRVIINGKSLGGYRDVRGRWWVRTARLIKVLDLSPREQGALRGWAESLRGPKFPPTTKRLKRGECLVCLRSCCQVLLVELDADLSWDGRPHPDLVAELAHHRTAPKAVTVKLPRR